MNAWLLVVLLATSVVPDVSDPALKNAEPGEAAAAAYELYQNDDQDAGCAAFMEQIREGSTDPWSFLGAALCAAEAPTTRDAVLAVLEELGDSHLVLFARGFLRYRDGDLVAAEELLRRAVERAPDFALAWNVLGAVVRARGDAQAAVPLIERALELSPDLEMARRNLETTKLCVGVFDRLQALLVELPARWDSLPEPRIPMSGRRPEDVVSTSPEEDVLASLTFILSLARAPLSHRAELIERRIEEREPGEVDLWSPGMLVQKQQYRSLDEAALTFEAWLQWATALARRDVLLFAVGMAVNAARVRVNYEDLGHILELWVNLPRTEGTEDGFAEITFTYANILLLLDENEEALAAHRKARILYRSVGNHIGEGNTFQGEADVLLRLSENERALDACRRARFLSQAVGDQAGEGNSFLKEAEILYRLGKSEGALEAYKKARAIYQAIGNRLGEGNTFRGEGNAFFLLGENEAALGAYKKARTLYQTVGFRLGEGNTFVDEAKILLRLGENKGALEAYRKARTLFQIVGDRLGEGNTFLGEANVLLLLGEKEGLLEAFGRAHTLFQDVGDQIGQGNTFLGEADALFRLGANEAAAESARVAGELFLEVGSPPNLLRAILREAEARQRLGESEAVIRLAEDAIDTFSLYRKGFVAEEHRTNQDQGIALAYGLLIPLLGHRSESLEAALSRAEEARSRVLLDLLTTGRLGGEAAPLDLQQENERLRAELARIGSKLRRENDPVRRREHLVQRHVLEAQLQSNLYRRVSAERQELEFGKSLDADAIRGLAAEVGPIVLFYAADVELLAFLIPPPPGEVRLQIIDLGREELGDLVETFLLDLSNPLFERRARQQAEGIWRQLLAPFAKYLPPSGPLTLVPHGPLHELPFEALVIDPDTGQRLFQRWDVTITPSVSALALARRRHQPPSADDNLVAFAAGVGLNLPEIEIRQVAGFFPASQQSTFGPTEAKFHYYEEFASRARHLLIATRGVHVEGSRRGTYLEILPTEGVHDERLSAAEIAAVPIEAELVTLAACDTARGTALLSDERLTLVRSFLIAGATSVLATRWRIPEDQSATRFLQDFYRAYRRGGPQRRGMRKDEALTEARRLSIERGDPAQVWAAWVLVGDAR